MSERSVEGLKRAIGQAFFASVDAEGEVARAITDHLGVTEADMLGLRRLANVYNSSRWAHVSDALAILLAAGKGGTE